MIRSGEEEALVEGLFDISSNRGLKRRLEEMGFGREDTLLLRRRIGRGRNRAYVNGGLATLTALSAIGEELMSIYGQHEHQSLLRPETHIDVLDSYGGLTALKEELKAGYGELSLLKRELDGLKEREKERRAKEELLRFQIEEIEKACLREGEEEELRREKERLRHGEAILRATREGYEALYSRDGSVIEILSALIRDLEEASRFDGSLDMAVKSLKEALYTVEDVALQLRDHSMGMDMSPERLDEVEERLTRIEALKRKFGCGVSEIIALKERLEDELEGLEAQEGRIRDLQRRVESKGKEVVALAEDLSSRRADVAGSFEEEVVRELAALGMEGARFRVCLTRCDLYEKGVDRVEFYLSPNRGEALRPLSRIASGGELSRIMLAIKMISRSEDVPTLIFDEVDAGIGGRIADRVGRRLRALSEKHQVICVTHLPQVASYGTHHYRVRKVEVGGRTVTEVERLGEEERVEELSRMLSGERITDRTRAHARELLSKADG